MKAKTSRTPIFSGEDGEDIAVFLQDVLGVAFEKKCMRDDDWIADYTATCLRGDALRWYIRLSPDVKRSGGKLYLALLDHFDIMDCSSDSGSGADEPDPKTYVLCLYLL